MYKSRNSSEYRESSLVKSITMPDLSDSLTTPMQDISDPIEKTAVERSVIRIQHQTSVHLNNQISVKVIISADVELLIIIDKTACFERLARQIEAEYFFRHSNSICCCIITDEDWEPYHFDKLVGKHLENNSIVRIVDYTIASNYELGLKHFFVEKIKDLNELDALLISVINDATYCDMFYDHLVKRKALQNLLFWLDVLIYKYSPNVKKESMRIYITLVYLLTSSPISISTTKETKKDVIDFLEGKVNIDICTFDELFFQINWILKLHLVNFLGNTRITSFNTKIESTYSNGNTPAYINATIIKLLSLSNMAMSKKFEENLSLFKASTCQLTKTILDRNDIFFRVHARYFPKRQLAIEKEQYFKDMDSNSKHLKEINDRLMKKFGARASNVELIHQISRKQFNSDEELFASIILAESHSSIEDQEVSIAKSKELKIKKAGHLNDFFGTPVSAEFIKNQNGIQKPEQRGAKSSIQSEKIALEVESVRERWQKLQSYLEYSSSNQDKKIAPIDENNPSLASSFINILQSISKLIEQSEDVIQFSNSFSIIDTKSDRKKIQKLEVFFGSEINIKSFFKQTEDGIFANILQLIDNFEFEDGDKKLLRAELDVLKKSIHKKLQQIQNK